MEAYIGAAVLLTLLALAAWQWWRSRFAAHPKRSFELVMQGKALQVVENKTGDAGVALVPVGQGVKVKVARAPGALDGVAGVTGVPYTVTNEDGVQLGVQLWGATPNAEHRLTLAWGAADPVYLEVNRDKTALLRASGQFKAEMKGPIVNFMHPASATGKYYASYLAADGTRVQEYADYAAVDARTLTLYVNSTSSSFQPLGTPWMENYGFTKTVQLSTAK